MKKLLFLTFITSMLFFFNSCEDDEEVDQEKPQIDIGYVEAFPLACDTLYFGETFNLKAIFTDNIALGSFSLDIHNNFDHHSHSTEVTECDLGDEKTPVNPYVLIQDFEIPERANRYEANLKISLPSGDENGEYDEGDYHFHINLVDETGWSMQSGVGIKIMHR